LKIIIAIDSFKDCLSSIEAAEAIASGIYDVVPQAEICSLPLADGGEGTVEAMIAAANGVLQKVEVSGPLGEAVQASYGVLSDHTAVFEVAAACGLPLIPAPKRNPLRTTTYGVGEMIRHAVLQGCRQFIIGLGGSATNDCGIGMLSALGWRFLDHEGRPVGNNGAALANIATIDDSGVMEQLKDCRFRIACDVDNPLYGQEGAAYIFAPQKGADQAAVEQLDYGLRQFAEAAHRFLGHDIALMPGAGAAGGLGAAFVGFLGGGLGSGIELVLDRLNLAQHMAGASLVITGEGRLDGQTARGKAPLGVARLAAQQGIPVIALAGSVQNTGSELFSNGITASFPIVSGPMSLEEAMKPERTRQYLRQTARQLLQLLQAVSNDFRA